MPTKVITLGASASRIYTTGTKRSSRSIMEIVKEYEGWPNSDGTTPVGVGPASWVALLQGWRRDRESEMTLRPGVKKEDPEHMRRNSSMGLPICVRSTLLDDRRNSFD